MQVTRTSMIDFLIYCLQGNIVVEYVHLVWSKEVETNVTRRFTRETRKCSKNVEHKSAVTHHADRDNCVIDWEGGEGVDRETNRCARWIKHTSGLGRRY